MGAKESRDIQIYSRDLYLADYKWSLKMFDGRLGGELVATQYFMVSSQGQAAVIHRESMGRYTLSQNHISQDDTPVYEHDENNKYLYRNKYGEWCVGVTVGHTSVHLNQPSENSLSPSKIKPWLYADGGDGGDGGFQEDKTLKVFP